MKQLKELLLPTLLDRMIVHHRLPPPPPSSAFHQVLLLANLYPIPLGEWRERDWETALRKNARVHSLFQKQISRTFSKTFPGLRSIFSGLQISCKHSNYLTTIFSQIIWMGRIMITMITMTIKSKPLTSTQSKEEASLNSCCIYEMLQKNHKNQEWFPRGTKTVKLISYLNKILFQTIYHHTQVRCRSRNFSWGWRGGGTKNTHKSNEVDKVPPDPSPRATTGSTDMAKIIYIITHY